jgi:hypothetical protein
LKAGILDRNAIAKNKDSEGASQLWFDCDPDAGGLLRLCRRPVQAEVGVRDSATRTLRNCRRASTWQLRQLYDFASRLTPGEQNPASLRPWDLLYVAGLVKDAEVGVQVRDALQDCGLPTSAAPPVRVTESVRVPTAQEPAAPSTPSLTPVPTPAPQAEQGALWVNLGAAASGQGIAVDARSVTRIEGQRQAWFRLLRIDGNQIVGETGYLLRVNCPANTITAHAGRTYGKGGVLVQQKDYPKPEGPLSIEGGTVMEVAFHALCDDAG